MSKTYYWIKLKENFFRQKEIKKLRKIAGGDTYTIIYFKLLLLAMNNNGVLIYTGIESSFAEELSLEIDEEPDNIQVTLNFLKLCGFLEQLENNEILLTQTPELVGKETDSAERVRKHRLNKTLQCNKLVTMCNTEKEKEKEKENNINNTSLSIDKVPYSLLVDLFHEVLPMLPKVKVLTDKRKNMIKKLWSFAWKEKNFENNEQALNFFRRYFESIARSQFLTGENSRGWKADIEFVFSEKCFLDKYENGGKYR